MVPSSRFALSLKPSVGYLVLNFCAGWKWQTMVPSLAYAGMPYHVLGVRSGALVVSASRVGSPAETVRVSERPGVAGDGDPVRPGALRRDPGVLGQGPALVERQLDVRRRGGELDVLAAEAPRHRQAPLDVELLGRGDVCASQQEHDVVDLPGSRAGVLLRRRRGRRRRARRPSTAATPRATA